VRLLRSRPIITVVTNSCFVMHFSPQYPLK
jgi:hypothetical protein